MKSPKLSDLLKLAKIHINIASFNKPKLLLIEQLFNGSVSILLTYLLENLGDDDDQNRKFTGPEKLEIASATIAVSLGLKIISYVGAWHMFDPLICKYFKDQANNKLLINHAIELLSIIVVKSNMTPEMLEEVIENDKKYKLRIVAQNLV